MNDTKKQQITMAKKEMGLGLGLGLKQVPLATLPNKNHDDLEQEDCGEIFEEPIADYSEGEDSDSDYDDDDDDEYLVYDHETSSGIGFDQAKETTEPIDIVYDNNESTLKVKACESAEFKRGSKVLWERRKGHVLMEGIVEEPIHEEVKGSDEGGDVNMSSSKCFSRTKSLTDEDLDDLKGCLDLGFGFNYEEIPELCNTLPALELCYSISQKFQDEQQKSPVPTMDRDKYRDRDVGVSDAYSSNGSCTQSPIANWKISSPGDHPEEVKARLKFWAQAVACTIRLCS